jgi:hypothetical protein
MIAPNALLRRLENDTQSAISAQGDFGARTEDYDALFGAFSVFRDVNFLDSSGDTEPARDRRRHGACSCRRANLAG